jgi:hypothetical protein
VQWSREGEMSDAPFGAAMAIEIEADLDAEGEIVDWRHSIWGNGHAARPGARHSLPCWRVRIGSSVSTDDLDQSAAGQWRRRRSQLDTAL